MIIRNDASTTKWPRLRSASEFKFIMGEEENAAQQHFPPIPTLLYRKVTERSRGELKQKLATGKKAYIQISS
mgnify:CR=1 FL=1